MFAARRFAEISSTQAPTGARVLMRRAVVLGGSVAGLMAARVLSDHAEQVVIIERDDLTVLDVPMSRPHLTQSLRLAHDPACRKALRYTRCCHRDRPSWNAGFLAS